MPITKKDKRRICILCRKREKREGSLFCEECSKEDVFVKIKALRDSKEYKEGWIAVGMPKHYGKLRDNLE